MEKIYHLKGEKIKMEELLKSFTCPKTEEFFHSLFARVKNNPFSNFKEYIVMPPVARVVRFEENNIIQSNKEKNKSGR